MKSQYTLLVLLLVATISLSAQVRINEAVSSNSSYTDEDGDTPDWFELYNPGDEAIDLVGYTLSDKANNPGKWTIPSIGISPDGYAFFWASGKDRGAAQSFRTFINRGAIFRHLIPDATIDQDWMSPDYDDAGWEEGPTGLGYGDGDDATLVPEGTISIFARKNFTVNSLEGLDALIFDIDYDDGFVAYLNGIEIARENISGSQPDWDTSADNFTEPRLINEAPPLRFTISNPADLLVEGENVLAIQVHNFGNGSSDLSLIPFLSGRFTGSSSEGTIPPAILNLPNLEMHTNFKISAGGETLFLHDPEGDFVDSLPVYNLPADVSTGIPGGGGDVAMFAETTPGGRNPEFGFNGVVEDRVIFSKTGGQVESFSLELSGVSEPNSIRLTTDGSEPTINSQRYFGPIPISQTRVIRAAAFRQGYIPSPITTETYLINTNHLLPVVSLVTEPDNFFHPVTGMYVLEEGYSGDFPYFGSNIWEDTEAPVNFSFYEAGSTETYSFDGGTKIFGGWSRAQDQRSLSIFARGRYGTDEMDYPFFPQRENTLFQSVVLRNAGNDLYHSGMRDVVMTGLMENSNVDIQAYRSVASYINGEYWGLYNLREKVNEHFLASKHGVDKDSIDILEFNAQVIQGSNVEYLELMDYIRNNPVNQSSHYDYIADRIDLDNYIQYQAAQIYYDNQDWPGNNIKYWKSPETKWRWILYDIDFGAAIWNENAAFSNTLNFALNATGPNWPNPPWSTFLFRRLITNETFRNRFVNQIADEMNSRFLPQPVIDRVNAHVSSIGAEIGRHNTRWGREGNWHDNVSRIRTFFSDRPEQMKRFIRSQFDLPAHHRLYIRISDTNEGYVKVNSLDIDESDWSGDYFQNVPIKVSAVPKDGYIFLYWELGSDANDAELTINMNSQLSLRPVFSEDPNSIPEVGDNLSSVARIDVSPNPSDGELRLSFTVRRATQLSATLYDAQGRKVRTVFDTHFAAGTQVQSEDLSTVPSGAYWLEFRDTAGGHAVVKWVKK
jgi:hypothetical protein